MSFFWSFDPIYYELQYSHVNLSQYSPFQCATDPSSCRHLLEKIEMSIHNTSCFIGNLPKCRLTRNGGADCRSRKTNASCYNPAASQNRMPVRQQHACQSKNVYLSAVPRHPDLKMCGLHGISQVQRHRLANFGVAQHGSWAKPHWEYLPPLPPLFAKGARVNRIEHAGLHRFW